MNLSRRTFLLGAAALPIVARAGVVEGFVSLPAPALTHAAVNMLRFTHDLMIGFGKDGVIKPVTMMPTITFRRPALWP